VWSFRTGKAFQKQVSIQFCSTPIWKISVSIDIFIGYHAINLVYIVFEVIMSVKRPFLAFQILNALGI
jgi:hypothetical protein